MSDKTDKRDVFLANPVTWRVYPDDEGIKSMMAITINATKEGYVEISQEEGSGLQQIQISTDEWLVVRKTIDAAMKRCKEMSR